LPQSNFDWRAVRLLTFNSKQDIKENAMKNSLSITALRLFAGAALVIAAPFAMAGGHPNVNWSVNIGTGYPVGVYAPAPQVVYVQPQPVYVRPQPVYVQPAAVVYEQPYYVDEVRYRKHKHHWKHHHGYDY
jgi:hypothetical protein